MKKQIGKGEYGYLSYKKRMFFLRIIGCVLLGLSIFVIGLLVKRTHRNIASVFAMLMVLPAAKEMVSLIVMMHYRSVPKKRYEEMKKYVKEGTNFYTDVIFTSPEKIMCLDFLVEVKGKIIGLKAKGNQDLVYMNQYLEKGVRNWGYHYTVKLFEEEEVFKKELQKLIPNEEVKDAEQKAVLDYVFSLIVS